MNLYRVCIITPNGKEHKTTQTFPRTLAEWHLRNLAPLEGCVIWIELAGWIPTPVESAPL